MKDKETYSKLFSTLELLCTFLKTHKKNISELEETNKNQNDR
jgi:hypothetical protein